MTRKKKQTLSSHECLYCQKGFRVPQHLIMHMRVHTKERPFFCDKCDATFCSEPNLNAHRRAVHRGIRQKLPPKRFECLFCHAEFRWNRDLENHMNMHTMERPHACNECNAIFSNPTSLGVHKRSVHTGYQCNLCEKVFKNFTSLSAHKKMAHVETKPRKEKRPVNTPRPRECFISINKELKNLAERKLAETLPAVTNDENDAPVNIKSPQAQDPVKVQEPQQLASNNIPTIRKYRKTRYKGARLNRMMRLDKRKEERKELLEENVTKIRIQTGEQEKFDGNATWMSSLQSDSSVQSQYPLPAFPNFMMPNGFFSYHKNNNDNSNNRKWDPSFFLHMNRYNPKDSCFYNNYAEPSLANATQKKTIRKTINVGKTHSPKKIMGFQLNKRGRPRKNSDEEENFANSSIISPSELKKLDPSEIERADNGYSKCPYCPKILFYCNLAAHLLIHTGEKPFPCAFCEFEFRQKSHMIKHIARYHRYGYNIRKPGSKRPVKYKQKLPTMTAEQDDFACPFCGKSSECGVTLEQHLLKNHNDKFKKVDA